MDETLYTAYLTGSLRLSKEGNWFHEGQQFTNSKVNALFHRSIRWIDDEQAFYVYIGKGRATFECEDTGYFVSAIDEATSPWTVHFLHQATEAFIPSNLSLGKEHQLYYQMNNGLKARLRKNVHQQILEYAESEDSLKINGEIVTLTSEQ